MLHENRPLGAYFFVCYTWRVCTPVDVNPAANHFTLSKVKRICIRSTDRVQGA